MDVNTLFSVADVAKIAINLVTERRNIRDVMGDPLTADEAMTIIAAQDLEIDLLLETLDSMFAWLETGEADDDEPEAEA